MLQEIINHPLSLYTFYSIGTNSSTTIEGVRGWGLLDCLFGSFWEWSHNDSAKYSLD